MLQNEIRNFIGWELASQDTIDFKKCYVDLCDDLIGGLLLSQIVYWHLPSKDSGKTKLRVRKDGHLWIAKGRNDWYEEIRITAKQYDRAIKILVKKDLVETKLFKFNATPTTHVRLKWETFIGALNALIHKNNALEALGDMEFDERVNSNLPFGENENSPLGNMDFNERDNSLTKSTNKEQQTKIKKSVNNNGLTKNDLIDICNSFYTEMAPNRYSKKSWGNMVNRLTDELITIGKVQDVYDPSSYVEKCLINICYKLDLRNGTIEPAINKVRQDNGLPFYDWINE